MRLDQNDNPAEPKRKTYWYHRFPAIGSGMFGTVIAALAVEGYWDTHPDFKPAAAFLFLLCLSAIFSYLAHWIFVLHPRELDKRLENERRRHNADSDPGRTFPPLDPR